MKTLLCTICMLVSTAFAGQGPEQRPGAALGFDDLRAACLDPAKFHNQVAPTNIQVSCQDVQTKWVADGDGTFDMNNGRIVSASVSSDKYNTATVSGPVAMVNQAVACPQFKEITETISVIHSMTCDELIAFQGTAVDYCASAADSLRSSNPHALATVATGRTVSLCAGASNSQAQAQSQKR